MMIDASKWCVLVVEDEFDSIEVLAKVLKFHGAEVHMAKNGVECLEKLKDLVPTLVLLDLSLPEMDGWETLKQIRSNKETAKMPVVAITAYHSASVAEDARRAGFNAYYAKPISTQTIVKELANLLESLNSD